MIGANTVEKTVPQRMRPQQTLGVLRALASAWKWLEQKRVQQSTMRRLRISETISLGEKRSIWIIQVDGKDYLVGGSAGSVALLSALDKQPSFRDTLDQQVLSTTEQA
ncbi:flagellar biosynthetic protein FliO [Granulicella sibirica]|uniref:Flagellar biosynthesis protein FliO n=1 Tax=Granulicella sibirica TaxID=2479048 RepID=A0A4Q0T6K4_9BACT|nr:flagellar biosynthetic protein FliO [Granulicella sibirica]RXH57266.1 hypothetical protein GRAN_0576 [Granulicella sibirica]